MANHRDDILDPDLPTRSGERRDWFGLAGSARSLAVARAAENAAGLTVAVTATAQQARHLYDELGFFAPSLDRAVMPDWETLPYDVFSPHQDIISQRLRTLHALPRTGHGVLLVPVATLMQRLAPRHFLDARVIRLDTGDQLSLDAMRSRLEAGGYRCVSEVMEHGEFAIRGSILDLFAMGASQPVRVDLFDDEIDSLRLFDPESQRSGDRIESLELLPAREFPTDEEGIRVFRRNFRAVFEGDPSDSLVYSEISERRWPSGIEYYLPLFFDETATLFDYLPTASHLLRLGDIDGQLARDWDHINERYEQRRHDRERPLLAPEQLFLGPDEVRHRFNDYPQIAVHSAGETQGRSRDRRFEAEPIPDVRSDPRSDAPLSALREWLEGYTGRVLFVAESAGRREALLERLKPIGQRPRAVDSWQDFLHSDTDRALAVAPLEAGFQLPAHGIAVVPENALFVERAAQRSQRQQRERDPDAIIRDLTDLSIDAPIVHEDHGVGRYKGLESLAVGDITTEFLTIEYAGGDRLYVPVSSLNLVSRYTGMDSDNAPLHRLGGEQWERAKRKAAQKARDAAAELLDIYARRAAQKGHAHAITEDDYERFANQFPFEETPDQHEAIEAVVNDMRSEQPMDRVICGDVGFGKTEVAMRGAFVGVQGGHQVAVLVPTTLLAQQHYQNFCDRFADWPVRVELLSRFRSAKDQNAVLRDLANGDVDIVIGTHKLLQNNVAFKDLGLLIVDEEHRFGVRQKEKLKELRANLDILTLTATPIPRTLNMSLAAIRDLSIIATPPARRLAVKTFVNEWNDALIEEAVQRELHRGGQVYFLHNDLDSIDRVARELEELVPGASIRIAHGRMRESELERVMLDFYHQRFNVLVCSTIIESGIDVPSANTIVINRADRFGLAQLHQLRGRVGRSHHRAYAYLIAPPRRSMSADAAKRLDAISSLEDLGIGFALASHDLEIRGAGELLGEGQSGQIQEVGFSMYTDLLDRAVADLRSGKEPSLEQPLQHGTEVDLHIPALLPEDYLPDVHTRLVQYKRVANADNENRLRELQVEMIDRFGELPDPAKNLFRVTELKLWAYRLRIRRIEAGPRGGMIDFTDEPAVDTGALVRLVQNHADTYRLEGEQRLRFQLATEDPDERIRGVSGLLEVLANREAA